MIDDKKIEEAATIASISDTEKGHVKNGYVVSALADHENGYREGYIEGAKLAINEFIKDLWHAIDENPKKYHKCLVEVVYHRPLNMTDEIDYVTSHLINFGWDESSFKRSDYAIKRWIYIDDLLKGCNHD